MRRFTFAITMAAVVLTAACTNGTKPNDSPKLTTEAKARLDDLVMEAKYQYDEGQFDNNAYNKAYELCNRALELDPNDFEAKVIRAWTLLQVGRYDEWTNAATGSKLPGARENFNKILEVSPNEFRARQGLAAIDFKEYYDFGRKAELMVRMQQQFDKVLVLAKALGVRQADESGRMDRIGEFLKQWKDADEAYRKLHTASFAILTDPELGNEGQIVGKGWTDESFRLDEILARVRREAFAATVPNLEYFRDACAKRAEHWDLKALSRLQRALAGFKDLERTGGTYYAIKHDIALAHMAMGDYFLRKAMADAEREFRSLRPDVNLSPNELSEVIGSYFADESLHKNPRRAIIKQEFAAAADKIKEFVLIDEEMERTSELRVEESRRSFTADGGGTNAVLSDILTGYNAYSREVIREMRSRRKTLILNMLMIRTYPQYLNQDLNDAKNWASALYTIDVGDPISFYIRGVIFEKAGELEAAVEEYQRFLDHSSIAIHYNRREFARDRIRKAKYEIERRKVEGGR